MKIVCVCGMGLGTSVMAKLNVEDVLKKRGLSATVDSCDVGSMRGVTADLFITTREIAESVPQEMKQRTLILTNFVRKEEVDRVVGPVLEKLLKGEG